MLFIKRLLYRILGLKNYLLVTSKFFFISYRFGFLQKNKEYYCHYLVKKLIKKGDNIIDIGANLGYYSRIFGRLTGNNGKVYSIEPVDVFRKILTKNTKKLKQVQIIPYALGKDDNKTVKMGLPVNSNFLRHGMTKIIEKENQQVNEYEFDVTMRTPNSIFSELEKLNYIKCDIEGYEKVVIPEMISIIEKFKPILQIETEGETRNKIIEMLKPLGYNVFYATKSGFAVYDTTLLSDNYGDLFFSIENIVS